MTSELRREIAVPAIRNVTAESCSIAAKEQTHDILGEAELRIIVPGTSLVEARPVELITEFVLVAQCLHATKQWRCMDELYDPDTEERVL
jgi:hypothetical protein